MSVDEPLQAAHARIDALLEDIARAEPGVDSDSMKIEAFETGRAIRYGVGVGRAGLEFKGSAIIERKAEWPSWRPTAAMIRRNPDRYARFADGMPGGPGNPLGARALYLYRNGIDTYFRIHGTTEPWSIGTSVSNGCIRMLNDHVMQLYQRVPVGTPVTVL